MTEVERFYHPSGGEKLTKESERAATEIKNIMKRWRETGRVEVRGRAPRYGDFTGVGDFHQMKNRVIEAEAQFLQFPADIRKAFGNDVGEFLEALHDPDRQEELEELGVLETEKPVELQDPTKVAKGTVSEVRDALTEGEPSGPGGGEEPPPPPGE